MIPLFNIEKIRLLHHTNATTKAKMRSVIDAMKSVTNRRNGFISVIAPNVKITMEVDVTGDGDPCSFEIYQVVDVIVQNIPLAPKVRQGASDYSLTLQYVFSTLDVYNYDLDFIDVLKSLGFKEYDTEDYIDYKDSPSDDPLERENTKIFELARIDATDKFWIQLRKMHGSDADPFESTEPSDTLGCTFTIYYHYESDDNVIRRKFLE